jgi:Beta protein
MQEQHGSLRSKKAAQPTKKSLRVERAKIAVPHSGLQFGHKHHVFIAKLKRGEVWALNHLKLSTKVAVTPLFEMWPPNPGTSAKPGKSLTQHTTDLMEMLAGEWSGLPCYIDTQFLRTGGVPSPGHAQTVFAIARAQNVQAIPVTSPFFAQPFQEVIRDVVAVDGRGVMFRLPVTFFNDAQQIAGYLDGLGTFLGVPRNKVDILVDLAYRPNVIEVQQMGAYCLNTLPFIGDWRTVTLAAGCFPDSISDSPVNTWIPFNRSDWNGWLSVAQQRSSANLRVPSYGDYGVRCGGEPVVIPNAPAPNIRYTAPQIIWVRKGTKAQGATRAICIDLTHQQFFCGAPFSQGDAEIVQKATTTNLANGTPEQWIQWCTNHHLEMTASQIQSLP